jgi:hypothetical protein
VADFRFGQVENKLAKLIKCPKFRTLLGLVQLFRDKNMSRTFFTFASSSAEPSITQLLTTNFGICFDRATTDQKLALIECLAFLMREGRYSLQDAIVIVTPAVRMPPQLSLSKLRLENFKEGLTLLALLYGGLNRDCGDVTSEDQ